MIDRYNSANIDSLISNYIYSYYVKYDRLALLINSRFYNSSATEVHLYIDLQDILRHLDKFLCKSNLPINNPLILTSGIINMVAHYRNFFMTRYSCTTKIWIVDSITNSLAPIHYKDFSQGQLSKNTKNIVDLNMNFLPSLCQYINGVQYVQTTVDFVTKCKAINEYENSAGSSPAICISKDPFAFQACEVPNMYILRPKKKMREQSDVSMLLDFNIVVVSYILEISKDPKIIGDILPNHLPLFMALTRVPSRNIKMLYHVNTAQNIIHNAMSTGLLNAGAIWDINSFISTIAQHCRGIIKPVDEYNIALRFAAIDTVHLQYESYKLLPEAKTYTGIVNLYDPEGVKGINNKYFKDCPLDLNVL